MKTRDIARDYGIDLSAFDRWLVVSGVPHRPSVWSGGLVMDDGQDVPQLLKRFREYQAEQHVLAAQAHADAEQAAQVKQHALSKILITSGFNFDGYTITKYSGYISGDDAISMDRPSHGWLGGVSGDVGDDMMAALKHIRRNALAELKEAAYALECNAVIGVDFDYLTLDPETVNNQGGTLYLPFLFGVTANGNAVVIEEKSMGL